MPKKKSKPKKKRDPNKKIGIYANLQEDTVMKRLEELRSHFEEPLTPRQVAKFLIAEDERLIEMMREDPHIDGGQAADYRDFAEFLKTGYLEDDDFLEYMAEREYFEPFMFSLFRQIESHELVPSVEQEQLTKEQLATVDKLMQYALSFRGERLLLFGLNDSMCEKGQYYRLEFDDSLSRSERADLVSELRAYLMGLCAYGGNLIIQSRDLEDPMKIYCYGFVSQKGRVYRQNGEQLKKSLGDKTPTCLTPVFLMAEVELPAYKDPDKKKRSGKRGAHRKR